MADEKPGSPPPEPIKPKPSDEFRPSFSYLQLQFSDAFTIGGRKFVSFFVAGDYPFYIHFSRAEFEEYQRAYFDRFDYQVENELCSCDETNPLEYELIDEEVVTIRIKKEDGTEEEIEDIFPIYALFNPVAFLRVGICETKHDK